MHPASRRSCTIIVRPRLHITLIGMNADGYRLNGGIGFCIDEPRAEVRVSIASASAVNDAREWPLQTIEQDRLTGLTQEIAGVPVQVDISGKMPSHYGFGSATGIRLAAIEGVAVVMGKSFDRAGLVQVSRRGGTSGIGVTTYFDGGLVFDLGMKNTRRELLPSSALEGEHGRALVISRFQMPQWSVGLCIPHGIPPKTEEEEVAFFRRVCPVPQADINETLYHVTYGVVASAREHDFRTFCEAIKALQQCTWKSSERQLHGHQLALLESKIYDAGAAAVGMSSLGPTLFFFADDLVDVVAKLRTTCPGHRWLVGQCYNSGREEAI